MDYNLIVIAAGIPVHADAEKMQSAFFALAERGVRFAFSAWHAYELARSKSEEHIDACCAFIEKIDPIWMSNGNYVKRKELAHFLETNEGFTTIPILLTRHAFNATISQMWSTYGGPVFVGETFRNSVYELRKTPGALKLIDDAARETPDAILIGRAAVANGQLGENEQIIDREYFANLVEPSSQESLDYVVAHKRDVLKTCAAIAVEEEMSQVRVRTQFRPEHGDAADLQHAIVGLAYCDGFITDDKMLLDHCGQVANATGLARDLFRSPLDLLAKS